jgi:hypothetical protein
MCPFWSISQALPYGKGVGSGRAALLLPLLTLVFPCPYGICTQKCRTTDPLVLYNNRKKNNSYLR